MDKVVQAKIQIGRLSRRLLLTRAKSNELLWLPSFAAFLPLIACHRDTALHGVSTWPDAVDDSASTMALTPATASRPCGFARALDSERDLVGVAPDCPRL